MADIWLEKKFRTFKQFSWFGLPGIALMIAGFLVFDTHPSLVFLGAALAVPWLGFVVLLPLWHWKRRYRGKHSDLWGALLLIETSGLFKLVYWFRHIIPDLRNTGRYKEIPTNATTIPS